MRSFLLKIILISLFVPTFFVEASLASPVKILLVPGHDTQVWGARYGNIKEESMTLELATQIYKTLKDDKRFDVKITRDKDGYTSEFAEYFEKQRDAIISFKENAKKEWKEKIEDGGFVEKRGIVHNPVNSDTSVVLYGVNKWASENEMDAVLHVHFNDYPRKSRWTIGKYTGFAIYTPDLQFANGKESNALALSLHTQLKNKYATSTYKPEAGGLIPSQKLIALGSSGTLSDGVRAVLIEYGYIYEKKFRTESARLDAYKKMTELTVTGIEKYFFPD